MIPLEIASFKLPLKPIYLMPIGDIQGGTDASDLDLLAENVARGMDNDAYFIGMGDYIDMGSPSNRKAWKASSFYDSIYTTMDEAVRAKEREIEKILAPTRGRWFGMLSGHHYWRYDTGATTDTNMCEAMQTIHLGDCAMVALRFQDSNKHAISCVIWAHHGAGSGTTMASPLNKLEKVIEWAEADIYLMGHQHKRVAANVPRFYVTAKNTLLAKERLVVCTGSYLKAYMQGSKSEGKAGGTYVEKAMMRPVTLGSPLIKISPVEYKGQLIIDFEVTT